jgi:outer membrane protein assembly factor BamB
LFYVTAWDDYHTQFFTWDQDYEPGKAFTGGMAKGAIQSLRRDAYIRWGQDSGFGAVRALNPLTGEKVWDYKMQDVSDSGILTTGSDLLLAGNREGYFFALDARTGKELWKRYLGLQVAASPVTYSVDGAQYISIAAGHAIFTFGLPRAQTGGR